MSNLFRIPTRGVCDQRLCQKVGCSTEGFPSATLRLVSQLREAAQLCNAAQLSGPQEPGIPHPACVCVYGLRNNTALTVSFTQSNSTKCLSELAFGKTRYNPIKCFTAGQCSSLARSLETGIKKSVLHFQDGCQEQACILAWAARGSFVLLVEWWVSTLKPTTDYELLLDEQTARHGWKTINQLLKPNAMTMSRTGPA